MIRKDDITGLILAGGRGSRMGGVDKGLQTFRGQPIVAHVMDRLRPQVGGLMINANRHTDDYAAWGVPVVPDAQPGSFQGPLAGMLAGLTHSPTAWIATAPCDSPFLPADLVERLAQALDASPGRRMAMACTVTPEGRRHREPVFSLIHRHLAASLEAALSRGEGKIAAWAMAEGCVEVLFDDASTFVNINTPEDLAAHDGA
jgi:molybdenum cofactor guanylyltransferase